MQLALAVLVVWQFQLESSVFLRVLIIASVGFVVHAILPLRRRLSFFVLLSLVSIVAALGVRDGVWLVAVGLSLIVACHLPIRSGGRVVVVLLLGLAHAAARAGLVPVPWSSAVWPILGSMFMFRIALYLHGLRHDTTPPTWQRSLAYFFMLPNVAYPLFPVVDYTGFGRSYYDGEAGVIYQRGIQWIARGLIHLLLYRFVYLYLTIPADDIATAGDLARSMFSVFLLYLRVSGQFHMAIGILHLFGFHLPETHKLYYLASSFTDFWRRINIYWKDFMMKLVYYPSFFRLRRFGDRFALVVATAVVFVTTWLLHSYQWFWLQGGFPISMQDGLFWGLLCVLVIFATLRETKRGRKRSLAPPKRFDPRRGLRITLMFCTLTLLWSLWSTESIVAWLWQWSAITRVSVRDLALILGGLTGFFTIACFNWDASVIAKPGPQPLYLRPAVRTTAVLALMLVLGQPAIYEHAGVRLAGMFGSLRTNSLNAQDRQRQFRGYYEGLDNEGHLVDAGRTAPDSLGRRRANLRSTAANLTRSDFLAFGIAPDKQVRHKGVLLTTNRWGMRDRDYPLEKPANVRRIAILGASITMGPGVADQEVFDVLMEQKLNELAPASGYRYEVLNFGVSGYSLLQQLALLEQRVFNFDPDIVVVTTPGQEHLSLQVMSHLTLEVTARGLPIPYPELRRFFARQGIREWGGEGVLVPYAPLRAVVNALGGHAVMPLVEAQSRLQPVLGDIVAWCLARVHDSVRAHGAIPVLLGMDDVSASPSADVPYGNVARSHGFVVINLLNLYEGHAIDSLRIASWDDHPNGKAHRMMAERLVREFQKHDATFQLGLSERPAAGSTSATE